MSRINEETRIETQELYDLGLISEERYKKLMTLTAKNIEIPPPVQYSGLEISHIRKEILHCSQKVFADILGVTANTVSKWERESARPEKPICRFLKVLEREGLKAIN